MEMVDEKHLFTPGALSQIFQLCHKIKAQSAGQLPQCLHSASSKGRLCLLWPIIVLRIHWPIWRKQMRNFEEIFNLRIQVMVVVIVVLVGIPYIILHNSLTADEQEDKYEEAHRWKGARKRLKGFIPDLLVSDLSLWDFKTSSPSSRAIHSGEAAYFFQNALTPTVLVKWLIY